MNQVTKQTVAVVGLILGLAGIDHGFFETLQGYTPTNGILIAAIGEEQRMWLYGGEEAITLIPNFLITGVVAMLVSVLLIWWTAKFMDQQHGATVFIGLCVLLLLVGGGIGFMLLALPTWAFATRIHKPLTWWRKLLPKRVRPFLAAAHPYALFLAALFFLLGLLIAVTGYIPGLSDPELILNIDWTILLLALGLFLFSFVAGLAADIDARGQVEFAGQRSF
jgi:hypothetical protein